MTIQEAILHIQHHMDVHFKDKHPHVYIKTALEMALETLKCADAHRWIPVEEALPTKSGWYLVVRTDHELLLSYSSRHKKFNSYDWQSPEDAQSTALKCSHWMALPELPRSCPEYSSH